MLWSIIGTAAAVLTTSAFIPQVIKMHRHKSARDVSAVMLYQLFVGVGLWIAYGVYLRNTIIIAANAVTCITLVIALGLYYKYK